MSLSAAERLALRNLAAKQAGETVDFIHIASARALTELGLAVRTREGWTITPEGQALLAAEAAPPPPPPTPMAGND